MGKALLALCAALVCAAQLCCAPGASAQDDFPLRPFYPAVQVVDTETLLEMYTTAVIVDVRSNFEFDVARINKAINAPLAYGGLLRILERLRPKDGLAPLVLYCNDPACSRAFRAAQEAVAEGWKNIYVYDAGVFAWIAAAPDKATLMGNSPASLERVIPPSLYRKHLLEYSEFERLAYDSSTLVIDIRDIYHRDLEPKLQSIRNIPMEALLEAVTNRIWTEKRLLIFDTDGSQSRWLQYFLQANGYSDYYFLNGGVEALDHARQTRRVEVDTASVSFSQHQLQSLLTDDRLGDLERRLACYVAGRIRFDNYALLDNEETRTLLGVDEAMLFKASDRLGGLGWLLYTRVNDSLVYRINPRLAWKGEMAGKVWMTRVREFEKALGR
ncbi:MAG: rhodanese-like domain-containing protein [Desulfovibrio sp.]